MGDDTHFVLPHGAEEMAQFLSRQTDKFIYAIPADVLPAKLALWNEKLWRKKFLFFFLTKKK